MPIPTQHDRDLAEVDDFHSVVTVRLRTLHHAGPRRDGASVREALARYVEAVETLARDGG